MTAADALLLADVRVRRDFFLQAVRSGEVRYFRFSAFLLLLLFCYPAIEEIIHKGTNRSLKSDGSGLRSRVWAGLTSEPYNVENALALCPHPCCPTPGCIIVCVLLGTVWCASRPRGYGCACVSSVLSHVRAMLG